jgi:hypothetical protein
MNTTALSLFAQVLEDTRAAVHAVAGNIEAPNPFQQALILACSIR